MSKVILVFAFLFAGGFVGCYAGYGVGAYLDSPAAVRWQSLKTPPEKPVTIVATYPGEVVVQTSSRKIFYCDTGPYGECWREAKGNINTDTIWSRKCDDAAAVSPPTSDIIEIQEAWRCGPEASEHYIYAVDSKGTVWEWHLRPAMLPGVVGAFYGIIIGALVGLFVGIWFVSKEKTI